MDTHTTAIRYEEWIRRMQEWSASGLSKKRYCAENGIKEKTFYYYQRRIRAMAGEQMAANSSRAEGGERTGTLIVRSSMPSIVRLTAPTAAEDEYTFKLNGVEISVSETISPVILRKLLEAARNAR